ncbi:MAG TPA: SAM-dependent methyltransferase [Amycolatopsis sp.]|nr:SAM-dependent methyltransferase [Amycolatopsis sp.]
MVSPVQGHGQPGAHPNIAWIHDFWLGGTHHDKADIDYAGKIELCAPHIPYLVRASRALCGRMVRYLLDQGVRQFVDLGSGIPTMGHVHEVAGAVDPDSRVVYVDVDPAVAAVGRALVSERESVAYVEADIRDPQRILSAPEFRDTIDLAEPVGLFVIETLTYLPDSDDPADLVRLFTEATVSGSYLGLTHYGESAELRAGLALFDRMFGAPPVVTLRDREQLGGFFADLLLVDPGVVPVPLWRPTTESETGRNPELAPMYTGLARKR